MLTLRVELLTGRYAATQFNDRNSVEWPPHPARLFSAAVAAWADAEDPDPAERAALTWWEQLGAPEISCSWGPDECSERSAVTHFVPVNDTQVVARDTSDSYRKLREAIATAADARVGLATGATGEKDVAKADRMVDKLTSKAQEDSARVTKSGVAPLHALRVLPDERGRQGRVYPTAIPVDALVTYHWPDAADAGHVDRLDGLLARIPRLGHSSSMVDISVTGTVPVPTLVPDDSGWLAIRVPSEGQLAALEAAFEQHRGNEPRTLPAEIAAYRETETTVPVAPSSVFSDDWAVLAVHGARLSILDTLGLARAVRGALMRWSPIQPAPEVITGHLPGKAGERTASTERSHLAIVPLPFAGRAHADSSIQGVALAVPTSATHEDRRQVFQSLGRWLDEGSGELRLGRAGRATIRRLSNTDAAISARQERWAKPARRWLTVTPIALDRHPGNLAHANPERRQKAGAEAAATIAAACHNIGLPKPASVSVSSDSLLAGSRPVRAFPAFEVRAGRLRRQLVHAEVMFDEAVSGPLLLGAGRYLGYGLCQPADRLSPGVGHD